MPSSGSEELTITLGDNRSVSGLWMEPAKPAACFVLAHGAGAGMRHPFLEAIATGLAEQHIATLRYQFPSMDAGKRRPDAPAVCHEVVRAAVLVANARTSVPLFAGGRSFGGRMTSQAQAIEQLPAVRGLAFLGFPLHPSGRASVDRAQHLFNIRIPMLFLQGDHDDLADLSLMKPLLDRLGELAFLEVFEHANHAFHVPARSGKSDDEVRDDVVRRLAVWMRGRI